MYVCMYVCMYSTGVEFRSAKMADLWTFVVFDEYLFIFYLFNDAVNRSDITVNDRMINK
jgi:hypothetical protein